MNNISNNDNECLHYVMYLYKIDNKYIVECCMDCKFKQKFLKNNLSTNFLKILTLEYNKRINLTSF